MPFNGVAVAGIARPGPARPRHHAVVIDVPYPRGMRRTLLVILVCLNAVVLLGQLWPEGAPPFARIVNIVFLLAVLGYLLRDLLARR